MSTFSILVFAVLPVLELTLIIEVGKIIGGSTTIMLLILTAAAGVAMARYQGFTALRECQSALSRGVTPTEPMLDGLLILLGGLLLLIPGFITDVVGFILLIPWGRKVVRFLIIKYYFPHHTPSHQPPSEKPSPKIHVEDADFRELP